MPNAKEMKFYQVRLRQLAQLGFAMPYEHQVFNHQPSEVDVEQCAPPIDCLLFDLENQGILYVVWLSVAGKRPGVRLLDFRFVPPWRDQTFQTLPTTEACRGEAYVLPNGWQFSRRDVLNLRFGASGWRLECRPVEGLLCGQSTTPIPREYTNRGEISVTVEFFGKSGLLLGQTVSTLRVRRSLELRRLSQRGTDRVKADFAAQRAQRWQNLLQKLTAEEAQRLGVGCEGRLEAMKGEPVKRLADDLFADPRAEHETRSGATLEHEHLSKMARSGTDDQSEPSKCSTMQGSSPGTAKA